MRVLSLLLGIAGAAAAQDRAVAQDIKFVNGAWQRLQVGGADAAPGLQVSSQVRVVLRGTAASGAVLGSRVTFRLIQRVEARTLQEAAARLTGTVSVTSSPVMTMVSAQGGRRLFNATLELYVPAQVKTASVEILRSGDIEIHDFTGAVQARTPVGDIQAENVGGTMLANTGGGHIRLGRIGGQVDCSTGAGSITVAYAGGDLNCRTAGGEIVVTEARGPVWLSSGGGNIAVERAARSVEAHSMQGEIRVGQAGGVVTADTQGGAIRIGTAAGVRAESAAGPVRLTGASGPLSVSTAIGSILAELLAGARLQDSSLVAASGDITVMIPSNVAVSVMATNERGGMPRLESDFSGVRVKSLNFERSPLAEGAINGGGPMLWLSGSGMIYLRKVR
jgi:DUF4097 and DUF4098 domain-containing protein YvlB